MTDWPETWYEPTDPRVLKNLVAQLRTEVGIGHTLKGINVRLIALRGASDDALFQLDDGRVAEVHLTWRQSAETDPRWPRTTIFHNRCLARDGKCEVV
jgi:hypothetical protein